VLLSVAISNAGAAAAIDGGGGRYQFVNECAGSSYGGGGAPAANSSEGGEIVGSRLQRQNDDLVQPPNCLKRIADSSPNWLLGLVLILAIFVGWKFHNLIARLTATVTFALLLILSLAKYDFLTLPAWAEDAAVSVLELGSGPIK
jgi:hypothetical protein